MSSELQLKQEICLNKIILMNVSDYADQDQSRRLWLRRLGHFYHENLEKYLTLHNFKTQKDNSQRNYSYYCMHSRNISFRCFIGPIQPSFTGKKIHSLFRGGLFEKYKSKIPNIIINYFTYLNNPFNKKIKIFEIDQKMVLEKLYHSTENIIDQINSNNPAENIFDELRDNINEVYYSTPDFEVISDENIERSCSDINLNCNLALNFEIITMSSDNESVLSHNNRIINEITTQSKHNHKRFNPNVGGSFNHEFKWTKDDQIYRPNIQ
ncbi:hypothetical protein H8356DRAFT_1433909 [Neocallimastix lanati (nom. inval.)]|nr:hypothetical protein H8356DRAFT_1433909 [Neocallimastix sp. JGI-2020a]